MVNRIHFEGDVSDTKEWNNSSAKEFLVLAGCERGIAVRPGELLNAESSFLLVLGTTKST